MSNKTYVINLLGGSGLGKSTLAAELFARMKHEKLHVELVREYVKEWAWEGKAVNEFGQAYIYGKQLKRESMLYNKLDFVVTDSPLILAAIYQKFYNDHESIKHQILHDLNTAKSKGVVHLNFLLQRHKDFDTRGRYEDEATAKKVDLAVENFLINNNLDYKKLHVKDEDRVNGILEYLKLLGAL